MHHKSRIFRLPSRLSEQAWLPALALSALAVLATAGCAQREPLTLAHAGSGLHLALPADFVDDTAEALRRQQDRPQSPTPNLVIALAGAFNDIAGGRGCVINHLSVSGDLRREWELPATVAQRVSAIQRQMLAQNDPWAVLKAGQWIFALPGQPPLSDTVQRSEAVSMGGRPAWLVITEQTWPSQSGPIQGSTRLATVATRLPASSAHQANEWLMVHCRAVHLPDYLPRYLDEALAVVTAAQWRDGRPPALAKAAATVPE